MTTQPVLIGLDWGTSNLRAYQIAADGVVVDQLEAPWGILNVKSRDFAAALAKLIGHWLERYPDLPVIACGMVGSRQGWIEAPYVDCPARAEDVAQRTITVSMGGERQIHIVPGLACLDASGVPDLMRGEETQIFGVLPVEAVAPQWVVLPGTHSKWAVTEAGLVRRFATFMTGELYDVLKNNSILGRMMEGDDHDRAAFIKGAQCATEQGGLLKHLFGVRSLPLLDKLPRAGVASYLSGLLIGSEIDGAVNWLRAAGRLEGGGLILGSEVLTDLYMNVLLIKGIEATVGPDEAAAMGLLRIARLRGLL